MLDDEARARRREQPTKSSDDLVLEAVDERASERRPAFSATALG